MAAKEEEKSPLGHSKKQPIHNSSIQSPSTSIHLPWKFEVDYNDHFETPLVAYIDIDLILVAIAKSLGKTKNNLIIYDPYYCHGQMIKHLTSLGYVHIINNNTDFYADVKDKKIPEFDVLVTNPPYSGDHKQRLLSYLQTITKPSLLLLPAYIATKAYWKAFSSSEEQQNSSERRYAYLLPSDSYQYQHPDQTGKSQPPFYSAWFISLTDSLSFSR